MSKPLAPMIAAAGAGWLVALALIFAEHLSWWCFGAAITVCGLAGCWRSEPRLAGTRAVTLVLGAAVAAVSLSAAAQLPARTAVAEAIGRSVTFEARVTSNASPSHSGTVWVDVVASIDDNAPAPLKLGVAAAEQVPFGAQLRVFAHLGEPWSRGASVATATSYRPPELLSDGGLILSTATSLRDAFIARATKLPGGGAELLPGLAVGDTRAVSESVEQAMLHSGLSHLTAVSGANCAIVTAIAFGAAALCRAPRALRVVIALVVLAGFVVLVTPEPSVIRAATMAAIVLLALALGRTGAGGGALALAVVVILIADPWLAVSAGFALSVASTAALLYLMSPLARGLMRFMPRPLAWAIAAPLSAQLACGPIIALFADEQSLVSVVANLLATPIAPVVTVIGMIGCLLAPIPLLADLIVACAWLPAQWIASTAEIAASLPNAVVPVSSGLVSAGVVALVSASVAVLIVAPRQASGLVRATATLVVAVTVAWALTGTIMRTVIAPLTVPRDWALAACDVGQGDAFVVRDGQAVALIDTGEDPDLLRSCLHQLSIERIDLLVLTHFDLDHVGGARALSGRVDTVLYAASDAASHGALLSELEASGAQLVAATSGMRGWLGELEFRILWPRADERVFGPGNAQSIVTQFQGASFGSFVALGDLGESEQRAVLAATPELRADVVKVAHHGSADQHAALYHALGASVALIGVGEKNTFGHPRAEILHTLALGGATTFRTDLHGLIVVAPRSDGIAVWTERDEARTSEHEGSLEK